jgi:hypothetical protein
MIESGRSGPISQAARFAWSIAVVMLLFGMALLFRTLRDGGAA